MTVERRLHMKSGISKFFRSDYDYFYCPIEDIDRILFLYDGGMPIVDISCCVGMLEEKINKVLDHILPYLE